MAKIKPNYELCKRLLADGWTGEEYQSDKAICASLLLCVYSVVAFDYVFIRDEFTDSFRTGADFSGVWDSLMRQVKDEFVRICLEEMTNA